MMPLAWQEIRTATRRAAWPVAVFGHAAIAALFVVVWGPTGGVPLWQAPVLQQLAAAERVSTAVVLTWLLTYIVTDEKDRSLADWSALVGRPAKTVFTARLIATMLLTIVLVAGAAPAFAAAGAEAAASSADVALQLSAALSFALFCASITALAAATFKNRVAVWCAAMTTCLVAAVAARFLDTTLLRAVVPAALALVLWSIASGVVGAGRLINER
jgi:hypothetical protein